jgi:predicted NBD/HSP70 family sugar kinase
MTARRGDGMPGRQRGEGIGFGLPAGRTVADDLTRGTNQVGVRLYNERLVLSLIRRHGSLPKAQIARLTGLSPQTITVIMRGLEADGLVVKRSRQRGKVGQPSVPFALDPDGALSLGVKVGRRSTDIVLLDFTGAVRAKLREDYRYPEPGFIVDFVGTGINRLVRGIPPGRIAGVGVATPFEMWNWEEEVDAPPGAMQVWRDVDIKAAIEAVSDWPVHVCNDATAACAAELVVGRGSRFLDFLYVFVGWFVGGGIVLNGSLFPGRTGYAGAVGPLPVPVPGTEPRRFRQLIHSASIYTLERQVTARGGDPRIIWKSADDWSQIEDAVDPWIDSVAADLALAMVAAEAIIDFEAMVVDGAFPTSIRARLVARIRERLADFDRQALPAFAVEEGTVGNGARAIGAACLPLLANFARDRDVLFKDAVG